MGLSDLLNRTDKKENDKKDEVVKTPAFDLTKVLATSAAVVAPIVTLFANKVTELNLTEWNWVALILGILGFLAIAGSADVLARSLATAADKNSKAAADGRAQLITFDTPLPGERKRPTPQRDVAVQVLGVAGGAEPYFLVKEGDAVKWCVASEIEVG